MIARARMWDGCDTGVGRTTGGAARSGFLVMFGLRFRWPTRCGGLGSVAGKNAVTHVGKLYNIAASLIAPRRVEPADAIGAARCLLVSRIGSPLDQPQAAGVAIRVQQGSGLPRREVTRIVGEEHERIGSIAGELAEGRLVIGRWPLRAAVI